MRYRYIKPASSKWIRITHKEFFKTAHLVHHLSRGYLEIQPEGTSELQWYYRKRFILLGQIARTIQMLYTVKKGAESTMGTTIEEDKQLINTIGTLKEMYDILYKLRPTATKNNPGGG
jgi:hypothetical protein